MIKKYLPIIFILLFVITSSASSEEILAKVNNKVITVSDFNNRLSIIPKEVLEYYKSKEGREKLLNDLVEETALLDEVDNLKIEQTPEAKKELELARKQVLIMLLVKKEVESKINITEGEIKDFYDKNKIYFKKPDTIKVSHILLKTQKEAEEILNMLKAGKNFETLAKEKSTCPSAKAGGDLGWVEKGQMVKEFDDAAFLLNEGQISSIIKTKFGYHVIKVFKKIIGQYAPLKEVKSQIIDELKDQKKEKMIIYYKEDLKKKKNIVINKELLNKINLK